MKEVFLKIYLVKIKKFFLTFFSLLLIFLNIGAFFGILLQICVREKTVESFGIISTILAAMSALFIVGRNYKIKFIYFAMLILIYFVTASFYGSFLVECSMK